MAVLNRSAILPDEVRHRLRLRACGVRGEPGMEGLEVRSDLVRLRAANRSETESGEVGEQDWVESLLTLGKRPGDGCHGDLIGFRRHEEARARGREADS